MILYITMATSNGIVYSAKSPQHPKVHTYIQGIELSKHSRYPTMPRLKFSNKGFWEACGKLRNRVMFRESPVLCRTTETHDTDTKECSRNSGEYSNISSVQEDDHAITVGKVIPSCQAISVACKFACNDAKFMNERAKNDIVLLSREIMRMNARARQDVAFLGSEFLKLDARAREDTEKVDHDVKKRAERLHHAATILKNKAQSKLKKAADRHWSDGALEADLRRANYVAKQRAMEDSLMALEFVKNIQDRMVRKMYKLKSSIDSEKTRHITLEKNGKSLEFLPGEVSADRITAIQEAYLEIASALSEADGIDYTDPEELELLVATLIDLDAMDGKSSVSLLAECSSSPDVNTRKALANALSAAPSMWTLGNAGMGALQRLAEDTNPAIAAAASKTILELKRQWEIGEGDSWRLMVNEESPEDVGSSQDD